MRVSHKGKLGEYYFLSVYILRVLAFPAPGYLVQGLKIEALQGQRLSGPLLGWRPTGKRKAPLIMVIGR